MELQVQKMVMCLLLMSMLWFVCKAQFSDISQPDSFQAAKLGESVTIACFISYSERNRVWYKLTTERKLQLVASIDTKFNVQKFTEQFSHFSAKSNSTSSHLIIPGTTMEDAGTYYCGVLQLEEVQFGQGTFLIIEGANMISGSVVQQPESLLARSGDSVILTCSVRSHQCDAEHTSVKWLKNSDHSVPGINYSSGYQNDSCQTVSGEEATCVYDLHVKNLSSEDSGVYYCVVTSCGRIHFGDGTRIKIHRDVDLNKSLHLSPGVTALILSNIIFGVATLLLVCTLCKNHKKVTAAVSRCGNESPEGNQNRDSVTYAAVTSAHRISSCRSAPVKDDTDMVVYSSVMCSQRD